MGDITKLEVWKISLGLAASVYQMTKRGELAKDYSLRDQIRRAAISIPSNIAEGLESGSDKQGVRYFYIAKGSIAELKTQILLASQIDFLDEEDYKGILNELERIGKMLYKLISYRRSKY